MSVRVRWLGPVGVALLLGASLLNSSTGLRFAHAPPVGSLNLRSARASLGGLAALWPPGPSPAVNSRLPFALPASPGGPVPGARRLPDGMWEFKVRTTVGTRQAWVYTNAQTVGMLLRAMHVALGKADQVSPGLRARIFGGLHVTVARVRTEVTRVTVPAPFETLIHNSKDLPLGATRTLREGREGTVQLTYQTLYRNGRETSRRVTSARVIAQPVMALVLRGTGPVPQAPPPTAPAGAAPAGAAPAASSAGGGSRVQYGQASWYECSGMFAAHLTLPKGTTVTVTNLDSGTSVSVVINDRGPYGVPGRIIDLCTTAFARIAPLAQGVARVRISW